MKEELLHHIWKFQRFNTTQLVTTDGKEVLINKAGAYNQDAGPDFFNSRITINNTTWAGNVEIHIKSSDWYKHNHQTDAAYQSIILHVVWEDDIDFNQKEGIPTIELKNRIPKVILDRYAALQNINNIPCSEQISTVDSVHINHWLERLAIQRLSRKSQHIEAKLTTFQGNWEEVFYIMLASNFGFKVNKLPFELLAESLSLAILKKHKGNLMQVEALLFGVAGLLEKPQDDYSKALKEEFEFLKKKYNLEININCNWKFNRMRPQNFPTVRMAQLAALISQSSEIFSTFFNGCSLTFLSQKFESIQVSSYWVSHYVLNKPSKSNVKNFGNRSFENIVINTLAPMSFAFGVSNDLEDFREKAIQWLETTNPENNSIIKKWQNLKLPTQDAAHTQALIELYNEYCSQKDCLTCAIGNQILKPS